MLHYPLAVLDFEASSLLDGGYPIEVGVAVAADERGEVQTWSSLIKPSHEWLESGIWNESSAKIHGIDRAELAGGMSSVDVAGRLNEICGPIVNVWCDGGEHDAYWLKRLYEAAGLTHDFRLYDISQMLGARTKQKNTYDVALAKTVAPHRAAADADRICRAIMASG